MSYAVLEVNLDAITSCRDDNYVLGFIIFNPVRRHSKTQLRHGICEKEMLAHLPSCLSQRGCMANALKSFS